MRKKTPQSDFGGLCAILVQLRSLSSAARKRTYPSVGVLPFRGLVVEPGGGGACGSQPLGVAQQRAGEVPDAAHEDAVLRVVGDEALVLAGGTGGKTRLQPEPCG